MRSHHRRHPEPQAASEPAPARAPAPVQAAKPGPASADAAPASPPADPTAARARLVAVVLLVAAVTWLARSVLTPFVVAAVIAYAFGPVVGIVARRTGLHRGVVVLLGYLIVGVGITALVVLIAHPLVREIDMLTSGRQDGLVQVLRDLLGRETITIGSVTITVTELAAQIQAQVAGFLSAPADAIHVAGAAGEALLQTLLALIVTFYFLLDGERFVDEMLRFLHPGQATRAREILGRIHVVLGRWMRGQLLLIALVAAVVYVILGPLLHVPYALTLAILTGFLEILPLVGPIIAAALAGAAAFSSGGLQLAAIVLVIYFVIRQVEDQVVMPVVIGRAVHLHPVVTIFAVLVGLSAYGILGGLLAVPAAAALNVAVRELLPPMAEDRPPEAPTAGEPPPPPEAPRAEPTQAG